MALSMKFVIEELAPVASRIRLAPGINPVRIDDIVKKTFSNRHYKLATNLTNGGIEFSYSCSVIIIF